MKQGIFLLFLIALAGCGKNENTSDATGVFEADEVIVSAEGTGKLLQFTLEEGMDLQANQNVGLIDSVQLSLKKQQLQAQIKAVLSKEPNIPAQLAALQEQIKTAEREKQRVTNLLQAGAATQKQLDDINAQISTLQKQLDAQQSQLNITAHGITSETQPLVVQIAQINDQLNKCNIINPVAGTVLTTYAKQSEVASAGKPLYKIANLKTMTLRAYVSGEQLPQLQIGQHVTVLLDDGSKNYKETDGTISWISDKAEFTPKTIQTKSERANLVYACKIKVVNDGSIKIGMYGEVKFNNSEKK